VNEFEGLARFSAGLNRLATFVERMESYQSEPRNATFALKGTRLDSRPRAAELQGPSTAAAGDTRRRPPLLSPGAGAAAALAAASCIHTREVAGVADESPVLRVSNLSLVTPDGARLLFTNVSFEVANPKP